MENNNVKNLRFLKTTIKMIAIIGLSLLLFVQGFQRISYYLEVPTYISSRWTTNLY